MQESQKSTTTDAARDPLRRAAKRAVARLRRGRADESGLTTLEWLLIVAAVAGLAALAVVLVQNVVDDTAEQIGGNSARGTAAKVAAERITREARAALPAGASVFVLIDDDGLATKHREAQLAANADGASSCTRLKITYGDIGETFDADWVPAVVAPGQLVDDVTAAAPGSRMLYDSAATGVAWTADGAAKEAYCKVALPEN